MNSGVTSNGELKRGPENRAEREAFVLTTYAELFRWFLRLTGVRDWAADLTQETFAAFWQSSGPGQTEVSSRTWLFAIGRNLWRKQLRDRKAAEELSPDLRSPRDHTPEQHTLDREFREAVDLALCQLPVDLREAFVVRFLNEFAYEEIGTIQGISAGLARWRYFAARRRLHQALVAWDPEQEQTEEGQHAR